MPTKNFSDFTTLSIEDEDLTSLDYLVGYRSSTEAPYEIKIGADALMASIDSLAPVKGIKSDKIYHIPLSLKANVSVVESSLEDKLNQLRTLEDFATPHNAAIACAGERLFVDEDVVLNVNGDFASIQLALDAIQGWYISNTGSVTINIIADLEITGPINLNHPFGDRIRIIGNGGGTGASVTLSISPLYVANLNFNLFNCTDGHRFGLIDNLIVKGAGPDHWNTYSAVYADRGAYINLGSNFSVGLQIQNQTGLGWYIGIQASNGSVINADGVEVANCGLAGFLATKGSQINTPNSKSSGNKILGNIEVGFGYLAEYGSQINCEQAEATGNYRAGFASFSTSQVKATGAYSHGNGIINIAPGSGFLAKDLGEIECYNYSDVILTRVSGNYGYAFETLNNGVILANQDSVSAPSGGTGIINKSAKLTITSNTPTLTVDGDSDVNLKLSAKGSGKIILSSDVQLGAYTSYTSFTSAISATGYITVYDSNGVSRKLLVG
jgi:hypothetical protein